MEESLKIPTNDEKIVYGTLNYQERNNKEKLVIFIHGLSGNQHEHQYFNAVPFFNGKGYDTFRFDFYSRGSNGRRLSECTIKVNTDDLNSVVSNFKYDYKNIVLISHSLGALAAFSADLTNVSKLVFWDPATSFDKLEDKKVKYIEEVDKYYLDWGKEMFVSKDLLSEWQKSSEYSKKLESIKIPCYFIFAEKAGKLEKWKSLIGDCKSYVVKDATHRFLEEGVLIDLYANTLRFLDE